MADQPDFIAAESNGTPDFIPAPSGQTMLQQSMRQHFQASENYDAYLHSKAAKAVPRPPMKSQGLLQEYRNASDAAHAQGQIMPQDMILGPLRDAATLTKAGFQSMVGGRMANETYPQGKAGLLGTPPSQSEFLSSAGNMAGMMALGAAGGEGQSPTPRLNASLNSATVSDPAFSGARSILGKMALRSGARMMGVPGSSVDVINALIKKVGGTPTVAEPVVSLPPEAPEIVRQGWAMYRGGQPAPPAQTGEALATVRQNSTPTTPNAPFPRTPTYQNNPSQGTPVPSIFEQSQSPVNMRTTYPSEAAPPPAKPPRPAPAWQSNPQPPTEIPVQGSSAEQIQAQLQKLSARKANVPRGTLSEAPQGGHAGGGVISAEEAARSGNNYIVDKNGRLTYHGKSFAPEATPSGGTHVTVMPDGTYRINAGTDLNAAQKSGLKNAIPNINEGLQSVPLKVPAPKAATDPFSGPRNPVMEPSQSTTIAQHGYHPNSQTMVVQFKNGNVYEYRGVPQEVFDAYKNSESQGSYFANNIKGRYTTNLRGNVGASPGFRVRQALGGKP